MYIEINLLPGPKRRKKAPGAGISLEQIQALVTQVKDPLLVGAIGAWVAALLFIAVVFIKERDRLADLEGQMAGLRQEAQTFQKLLDQKQEAQALRDSLVVELEAIRRIDGDRYIWPHILDEVTRALPEFTWLTNIAALESPQPVLPAGAADTLPPPPLRIQITGRAADIGGYTQFSRQLANSPWLGNLELGSTTTVPGEDGGRPVYAFSITATFRWADSAFIQTVPVGEGVR